MKSNLFKDSAGAQFVETIITHREAILFIQKHKVWKGFWNYGWVSRILVGLAILFGFKFLSIFMDWWNKIHVTDSANAFTQMGLLIENMAFESYDFLFVGSLKYIMLILLEVIIFHICRRTLEILTKKPTAANFKTFLKAQIRMIKVVIRCYFMEMFFTVIVKIGFGFFGALDFLEPAVIFAVQCYFLGFLLLDNYNEQFHLTIKESAKYNRQFIGVAVALGAVLNFLLIIPAIGAIIGPVIGAVTVTLVMYRLSDLHLREAVLPEQSLEDLEHSEFL